MKTSYTEILKKFSVLEKQLTDADILSNSVKLQKVSKEYSDLKETVQLIREYAACENRISEAEKILASETDPELLTMAEEDTTDAKRRLLELEERLKIFLLPKDPLNEKNIIVEIRAGAGGDESSLFAAQLYRMYAKYAERHGWKITLVNTSRTDVGGFKEIIFEINGERVYSTMRYESGVHRVQRVPETEKAGRVHTSTVTVAVLPQAEEVDMSIADKDIRIDVFRSGGHGGQSVNTTDSAVRITHLPTGTIVSCQDEKSQIKNREKAMRVLRSRLLVAQQEADAKKRRDARFSQIGTGDRSEKIRTYNFPQDRITDHRIKYTWNGIDAFLEGALDPMFDILKHHAVQKQLSILEEKSS